MYMRFIQRKSKTRNPSNVKLIDVASVGKSENLSKVTHIGESIGREIGR